MAYQLFEVAFGEQPSATKWNYLGDNDASINDGTGINPANNQYLNWQGDNSKTRQGLIKLGSDDYIKLGSIWYQNNLSTNNSKKNDVTMITGWSYAESDGTASSLTFDPIILPASFDQWLCLTVESQDSNVGSDPSSYIDNGANENANVHATSQILSNNSFRVRLHQDAQSTMANGTRWIISWVAMGVKS